jgi:hypothetical protein
MHPLASPESFVEISLLEPADLRFFGRELDRLGKRQLWQSATNKRAVKIREIRKALRTAALEPLDLPVKKEAGLTEFTTRGHVVVARLHCAAHKTWGDLLRKARLEVVRSDTFNLPQLQKLLGPGIRFEAKKRLEWVSPLLPFP